MAPFPRSIRILFLGTLILAGLLSSARASDLEILSLQKRAPFETGLSVPDTIKDKCELETSIVESIESFARSDFEKIVLVDSILPAAPGKALAIKITDLSRTSGGVWSGPKHLTIDGILWQDGKVIGTFTATRTIGSSAWEGYRGTCALLGRCAKNLGKDVAGWLKNPCISARLGDTQ